MTLTHVMLSCLGIRDTIQVSNPCFCNCCLRTDPIKPDPPAIKNRKKMISCS